jgi:predicted Zn-dependent peptidase
MASLGKNTLLMNKVFEIDEIISSIDKVTLNDILRVSEKITNPKAYSGVLLSKSKRDLEKLII